MKFGELPREIQIFAVLWLLQSILGAIHGLAAPEDAVAALAARLPDWDWGQPAPTLLTLLRLGIAMAPLLFVLKRANWARWVCVFLVAIRARNIPATIPWVLDGRLFSVIWMMAFVLAVGAVVCLFSPNARRWLSEKSRQQHDVRTFE